MYTYLLAGGLGIGYVILLAITLQKSPQPNDLRRWLFGTLLIAFLAQASYLLQPLAGEAGVNGLFPGALTPALVSVYFTSLMLVAFTALTLRYLERPGATAMLLLGFIWLA